MIDLLLRTLKSRRRIFQTNNLNQRIVYEIHRLQKSAYRHSRNCSGDDADGEIRIQPEPYQIQCVHLEDTIGMGYVACRLFDMNNISKQIKSSKPDFLYTEREFWEFYPERDLN